MATESDLTAGTITLTNGSDEFTGVGTSWLLAGGRGGDTIIDLPGTPYQGVVKEIISNTVGKLTKPWDGPDLTVAFRYRFQPDGSRVAAQARNLIELLGNGNLQAMAGLTGSANQVIMFTGPGAMTTISKSDLISGAAYNVQVDDPAAQAAYDGQAEGFTVLISDMGDGRAAIESKASNASGDWSDPAYVTGPPSTVPGPAGASPQGTYNPATAYQVRDAVLYNGSTFIALGPTTGNTPPNLPVTSNAFWQLLARQGIDGAGTVNSVVAGDGIAVDNSDPTAPVVSVSPMVSSTLKGRLTAGVGLPQDLTATQAREVLGLAAGFPSKAAKVSTSDASAGDLIPNGEWWAINTGIDNAMRVDTYNGGVARTALKIEQTGGVRAPSGPLLLGNTATAIRPGYSNTSSGVRMASDQTNISVSSGDWVQTLNQGGTFGGVYYLLGFRVEGGGAGGISSNGSVTTYATSSDVDLKTNFEAVSEEEALGLIEELNPLFFEFRSHPGKVTMGFVAHEVQQVAPWAVVGTQGEMEEIGTATMPDVVHPADISPEGEVIAPGRVEAGEVICDVPKHMAPDGALWVKTGKRQIYQQLDYSQITPLLAAGLRAEKHRREALEIMVQSMSARLAALE